MGAHSQTHSLTAVINTMGLLTVQGPWDVTAAVNYTGRWSTIAVACQTSNVICQLKMRCQLISASVLLSFWTCSLPFCFRFYWHFCFR